MKVYKYKEVTKRLSKKGAVRYASKLGKKGWRTVSIMASGASFKGKREHVLFLEKQIKK